MMCFLSSRPAVWRISTSVTAPTNKVFCKGWTINRAKVFPVESDSIARLACELRRDASLAANRFSGKPIFEEPKTIQVESLSIQCHGTREFGAAGRGRAARVGRIGEQCEALPGRASLPVESGR